jgi:outer membrane protein assembly factor BamB
LGSGKTGFTSSPVTAGGRIYFASEEGDVHVLKTGLRYDPLGINRLGEIVMASPAIAGNALYYRTRGHVVAIGE